MDGATRFHVDCPSRLLFEQIADKWSMMILTVLDERPARFNELRRRLEGISQKSLSTVLRRLERNGLVNRRVLDGMPVAVEYSLSPLGVTLLQPFRALYRWTCDNMKSVEAARQDFDRRTQPEKIHAAMD
ncbi:winged helix-turn-helix transcriptional regulator [Paracoccus shanxieyensis]|uniref:Transcriptional regulator n=1 Tax=Paracoccus shanxieyensis TaxID=2675752 RepID=A0A6L6IYV8_9RHOB|nr:helix-turn-helix domain-containing protein [Paracoccus shanxieyensis]MTH64270.1 transcriptional regulator [Paracoccus shanxieyensis]MTH87414.1 transcriptional regulator [Paracoccus shanxieyensis]